MRFLLGILVGDSMRGKKKLLITVLATVAFILYIILLAIALDALFGRTTGAPVETRSNQGSGAQRIEL